MPGRAKEVNGKARSPGWGSGARGKGKEEGREEEGKEDRRVKKSRKPTSTSGAVQPWLAEQAEVGEWTHVGIYSKVVSEGKLDKHRPGVRQDL